MKRKNKTWCISIFFLFCLLLTAGCQETAPQQDTTTDDVVSSEEAAEEEPTANEKVLLVVSFGTSYNDNRELTIGAIEQALQKAYPDYELRRAFTAQTIIDILAERDNLQIDNVTQAMERLVADGVREVLVQPTHVMRGYEYDDTIAEIAPFVDQFDSITIGAPLLAEDADYQQLTEILVQETKEYAAQETAIVFMGHGTGHAANSTYATLQQYLTDAGHSNYFIGTVEAEPTLDDVLAKVADSAATRVVLLPLMVVAGDHASNDMAGDEADSWKNAFTAAGYEVECVMRGLGEYSGVQEMFVAHAGAAVPLAAQPTAEAAEPLTAGQILDGSYEISVSSSSSMFRIVAAELTVQDGAMSAVITLSGDGYGKLFLGTAEEAAAAEESSYIPFVADDAGMYTYTLPVSALNQEIALAAWSTNKETWYDRTVIFKSAQIPPEALIE